MIKGSKAASWRSARQAFLLAILLSCLLLVIGQTHADPAAQEQPPAAVVHLTETALAAPVDLLPLTTSAESKQSKLDSALRQLFNDSQRSANSIDEIGWKQDLRVSGDLVQTRVLVAGDQLEAAQLAIEDAGGSVTYASELSFELQAWIPIDALASFETEPAIVAILRPATLVPLDVNRPTAFTEGFNPLGAQAWHDAGKRGAGVKIAVIDGGFIGYESLRGSDLPFNVNTKNFVDGEENAPVSSGTSHGTGCTEIIYDIAPNAQYYLLKVATNLDLQEAVNYAIGQGVDVISTSIGWYNLTPGDGSGQFADLANLARANGIIWLTAAGNDRQAHWGGLYSDPDGDDFLNFDGIQEINYYGPGNGDAYLIPTGTYLSVFARWDDWQAVNQDFALHLVYYYNGSWRILETSDKSQNGWPGQRPTEELIGFYNGPAAPIGFVIERKGGSRTVNFEIFAPKVARLDELVPERSLANLADVKNVVTVGAVNFAAPYAFQSYSAQGPTNGPGGALQGGYMKPDLAGYTGVSTETYGTLGFDGTSSSAPHAAGAAALIKDAKPCYSPDAIRNMLQSRAGDLGAPGVDTQFGYGRLMLGKPRSSIVGLNYHVYSPIVLPLGCVG